MFLCIPVRKLWKFSLALKTHNEPITIHCVSTFLLLHALRKSGCLSGPAHNSCSIQPSCFCWCNSLSTNCSFNLLYPCLNSIRILQTSQIKCHLFHRLYFHVSAVENYFCFLNHDPYFDISQNYKFQLTKCLGFAWPWHVLYFLLSTASRCAKHQAQGYHTAIHITHWFITEWMNYMQMPSGNLMMSHTLITILIELTK